MTNNYLSAVETHAFCGMQALGELGLGENWLEKLTRDMFRGLSALKILRVNDNRISSIEDNTFVGHNNLNELDISGNKLKELSQGMFTGALSLQTLHIQKIMLTTIGKEVFVDLKRPLHLAVSDPQIGASHHDNPLICNAK